jgi:hypothetical protein
MRLHHLAASVAACLLILADPAHSLTVRAKQEQCPEGNRIPTCPPKQAKSKYVLPKDKPPKKPAGLDWSKVKNEPGPRLIEEKENRPARPSSGPIYDYGTCTDPKQRGC